MTRTEINSWIEMDSLDEQSLLDEKFDFAIIGHDCDKIIYDVSKMINILTTSGMELEEAEEYLEDNCFSFNKKAIYMFPYNSSEITNYLWFKSIISKLN